jgi:hypothetical protein
LIRSSDRAPATAPGEQRRSGRHEHLVLDRGAVDVRMRPDEYRITEHRGMAGPAADQRVLHHHDVGPGPDLTALLGGQDRTVQHPGPLPQHDRAGQHSAGRDIGRLRYDGAPAAMLDQHRLTGSGRAA